MRTTRLCLTTVVVGAALASTAAGQNRPTPGSVVYAAGQEPVLPLPIIGRGIANLDASDQLFLHLAVLTPPFRTDGDKALRPQLAKSWRRVDPLTIEFELDPRARWHDGTPVTSRDVVFTWGVSKNPRVNPDQVNLEPIESVEATGPRTIRVRYRRPFSEQLYRFAYDCQPLPAHLLERMPAESIATSAYAKHPIGNGPFRYERRVPGQFIEMRADTSFFLGRPTMDRLIFRFVQDPVARLNLLLSGETDVMENVQSSIEQIRTRAELRTLNAISTQVFYFLFNTRSPADTSKPHPSLGDVRVREALTIALDRHTMARATFGSTTQVPDAAQSQLWSWIIPGGIAGAPQNVARAKQLLADAGWRDGDGDGVLDRAGVPLKLRLIYPSTSATRHAMALQAQQMWRAVGAQVELDASEFAVYITRRNSGNWDLDASNVSQDPSPSTLVQSWTCEAAKSALSNVARWCDPEFDRLLAAAGVARNAPDAWRAVLTRMTSQHPAIFLAAPMNVVAVNQRLENVTVMPGRQWLALWQWRVRPGTTAPRDR